MAEHAHRVGAADVSGGVEGVNGSIHDQHVIHLVAEAAKMSADIEIGVNLSDLADCALLEVLADGADMGVKAAILHHGIDPAGVCGGRHHLPRVG